MFVIRRSPLASSRDLLNVIQLSTKQPVSYEHESPWFLIDEGGFAKFAEKFDPEINLERFVCKEKKET